MRKNRPGVRPSISGSAPGSPSFLLDGVQLLCMPFWLSSSWSLLVRTIMEICGINTEYNVTRNPFPSIYLTFRHFVSGSSWWALFAHAARIHCYRGMQLGTQFNVTKICFAGVNRPCCSMYNGIITGMTHVTAQWRPLPQYGKWVISFIAQDTFNNMTNYIWNFAKATYNAFGLAY